jgi:hypothetical protein
MAALTANSKHIKVVVLGIGEDTVRLFYSYNTVVGMQRNNDMPIFTDERFSVTTSRHIRKFMYEHGGEQVCAGYLCDQLKRHGIRARLAW